MSELIDKQDVLDAIYAAMEKTDKPHVVLGLAAAMSTVKQMQAAPVNPQEPKTGWNNHQIACMLADLFGDACACNYNGNDEWLSELCDFKDTCCPNPVGVACWEQFLKYSQSRYTECDYEVRDKNALQEPKTGHWILLDKCSNSGYYCSECQKRVVKEGWSNTVKKIKYCPNCGAKMEGEE